MVNFSSNVKRRRLFALQKSLVKSTPEGKLCQSLSVRTKNVFVIVTVPVISCGKAMLTINS
jgi:hypothetical protein